MKKELSVIKDFPIFSHKLNKKRLVYLDSSATSQKPKAVINEVKRFYEQYNANVHRGLHSLSEIATRKYESARMKVAQFINAQSKEIIFVRNTTEAINLAAYSFVKPKLKRGDAILLTEMEHHSNIVPWQLIARETGAILGYVPLNNEGRLDMTAAEKMLNNKPKIFAFTHVSNVLGTINPVKRLVEMAHAHGVPVLVDGAQSVPHMRVDVKDLDCDFFAFSGHKMFGPTGVGVLYGKKEHLQAMEPVFGGGDMIKEVGFASSTWNDIPWKFEAGTPNIAGVIGLGAAVDYINELGIGKIKEHNSILLNYLLEGLKKVNHVHVYGPRNPEEICGAVSFNLGDMHSHDVTSVLDGEGICVRSGHHCAMPLMEKLGISSTVRASVHVYNTKKDVDALIAALEKARRIFKI